MDFFGKIRSFLGLPSHRENHSLNDRAPESYPHFEQSRSFWHDDEDEGSFHRIFGEFDRIFQQQMGEMMRGLTDSFLNFSLDNFQHFDHPAIGTGELEDAIEEPQQPQADLRSQFLKPGYDQADFAQQKRPDQDLDGKLDLGDLDSIISGKKSNNLELYEKRKPDVRFFGKSFSSQTIRKPDGSIEMHQTVRDNQGNEETTITKRIGDKEYTIIKKRDKNGKEEIQENLININDEDLSNFKLTDEPPKGGSSPFSFF